MKTKTIAKVLGKKIDDWLASIDDEGVKQLASKNSIVTGGCIASMLLKEKVNDFDVYFRTKEAVKAVAEYYVRKFAGKNKDFQPRVVEEKDRIKIVVQSAGVAEDKVIDDSGAIEDAYEETEEKAQECDEPDYVPVFLSTNAISLSKKVQLVLRFYGDPADIHTNYDFIHCTNYWSSWDRKLHLRQDALESIITRELRYVGSKYPVCSMFRVRKFVARGWTINAGQMLKIAMQISDLNLKDLKVLEDQLTGVDVVYFMQIVADLKDKHPEKVDTAYLVEILDRVF